jgi:LPXTG-motif cell wall-anchored protein
MLAGALLPLDRLQAQIGYPATYPSDTGRHATPIGWIGSLGLLGLLGLMGGRRKSDPGR